MAVKKKARAAKKTTRGKSVKTTRRTAAKKSPAKKTKKSAPRGSALNRMENALLATLAEVDELAVEMGLAGAVPTKKAKRKAR